MNDKPPKKASGRKLEKPRTRKIDGQEFTVVWSSSPLPSAEQCQSSLRRGRMNDEKASRSYLQFGSECELVEFPLPRGQTGPFGRTTEEIQMRHIPNHVATKIEQAIESDDSFFHYKGHKNAPEVAGHLIGSLQGLQLVDGKTSKGLDSLLAQFSRVERAERKQFVQQKIRPFLGNLRPGKRQP